ncbi:terpenoid synthase [Aspergillus keveii]|uniref:Terpene synthase n=1 Tax=Aspergillus keveii TaxID=714993 RepID=A0ABR4GDZ3_9EURO
MATVSRAKIIERLQQETITITGLRSAFSSWPFRTNPHLSRVREEVEKMLVRRFRDHLKLHTLLRGDYGLFGATWWPCAEYKELLVATRLSLWLFMWDDELDSDAGSLAQDVDQGQRYRAETLQFVTNHLGLEGFTSLLHSRNSVIQSFDYIETALRESCSVEQRKIFLKEFRFFMNKSETEQTLRLRGSVVTMDELWRYRLGTSAVRVVLAINQYCHSIDLPWYVTEDADFAELWHWTNINICSVNDLLSVKKEIAQGSAESLVPILCAELGSAQEAADQVMETVRLAVFEFDLAAKRLLARYGRDTSHRLEAFIAGCRYYCTGNLTWSMSTGRYGVHQELGTDRITISLAVDDDEEE